MITRRIRVLGESILVNEFLSKRIAHPSIALEARRKMEFIETHNTALGLAVKRLLQGNSLQNVKTELKSCTNLEADLARGYEFW
jgi:hypothetical protein